jgi:hypothetical protein
MLDRREADVADMKHMSGVCFSSSTLNTWDEGSEEESGQVCVVCTDSILVRYVLHLQHAPPAL